MTAHFEISSVLPGAAAADVWAHAISWRGVNAELAPIAMSHPAHFPTVAAVPADGHCHFVSVLSVFGLPFDRHRLGLVALEPGRAFHERSSNHLMRTWEHCRTVEAIADGVRVTDRCSFEARRAVPTRLLLAIYRRVFARRHRRLRARFATP